jgi:hypothetical protein
MKSCHLQKTGWNYSEIRQTQEDKYNNAVFVVISYVETIT